MVWVSRETLRKIDWILIVLISRKRFTGNSLNFDCLIVFKMCKDGFQTRLRKVGATTQNIELVKRG